MFGFAGGPDASARRAAVGAAGACPGRGALHAIAHMAPQIPTATHFTLNPE
jgi:hypothetical protein